MDDRRAGAYGKGEGKTFNLVASKFAAVELLPPAALFLGPLRQNDTLKG